MVVILFWKQPVKEVWKDKMNTRWAPAATVVEWGCNPCKWPYEWVTGVITLLIPSLKLTANAHENPHLSWVSYHQN